MSTPKSKGLRSMESVFDRLVCQYAKLYRTDLKSSVRSQAERCGGGCERSRGASQASGSLTAWAQSLTSWLLTETFLVRLHSVHLCFTLRFLWSHSNSKTPRLFTFIELLQLLWRFCGTCDAQPENHPSSTCDLTSPDIPGQVFVVHRKRHLAGFATH